jgi:hypothetical protein
MAVFETTSVKILPFSSYSIDILPLVKPGTCFGRLFFEDHAFVTTIK